MSGFSPDWLAMREPYDAHARNPEVLAAVAAAFAHLPSMTIVDLACGTGSTRRAVAESLPRPQHWKLVDNDLSLLARAGALPSPTGCTTRTVPVDLVRDLEMALDGACDLITCSALLDLVSQDWLDRFVTECAARRLPVYAAINYNGRVNIDPTDRIDSLIIEAVNRHQTDDKGFGPALGPKAVATLGKRFTELGYEVREGDADWVLNADDTDMQRSVLTQWALAAQESADMSATNIASWLERRIEHLDARRSRIRLGHTDVFARPIATR
ncbi:MAG: class I SAM-dependent methyltransferase [Xanthobacteraceae bacterium]